MLPTGHRVVNGVPYINGKRAIEDENPSKFTLEVFSK